VTGSFVQPRSQVADGRLVVRYAAGVVLLWIGLAVAGLAFGMAAVSGDNIEGGYIGLGLGVICTFVAWFAGRPVITADQAGLAVLPLFGSRTSLHWGEVRVIGVRHVRAARGRRQALMIDATDDREVKVDGLWVGLTGGALLQIQQAIDGFATAAEVARPVFGFEPDPDPW
jgi:hypothetical protein